MKCKLLFLIVVLIFSKQFINAQEIDSIPQKGNPIVVVFSNFDYNATKNADKKFGFSIGRAFLGYQYRFNKEFSAKTVIDVGRPTTIGIITVSDSLGNPANVTNDSKEGSYYTMVLKFASIEWKPNSLFNLQAGVISQNHYITQEKFWGYRYLAETFQDRYYRIPSSDLGFIAYVKPNEKFGFDFALTNGEGFRFEQDKYGDVKIASGFDFYPVKKLQTRLFYDYTKSNNPAKPDEQQLFSAFAGYRFKDKFRIGGEYNYRKNHLNISNQDLFGYSVYGSYIFSEKFEYFARFDRLISNIKPDESDVWNYNSDGKAIITGVQYCPVSGIKFSLNYQGFFPENKDLDLQHHILLNFEYKL